jgi:hypothetical protein
MPWHNTIRIIIPIRILIRFCDFGINKIAELLHTNHKIISKNHLSGSIQFGDFFRSKNSFHDNWGGGWWGGDRSNPLLKYKESEEIQCPNVKLSNVYSVPLHATVFGNKLIWEFKQLGTDSGISIGNCAVAGFHIGLESSKVVGGSRHRIGGGELIGS